MNKNTIDTTLRKLAGGQEAKIAFLGDSITVGAEAPMWWADLWTRRRRA